MKDEELKEIVESTKEQGAKKRKPKLLKRKARR